MDLDREACYRAVTARDRRFDGRFFTGVAAADACLLATIAVDRLPALSVIAGRLRHLFDLDADPELIAAQLGRDPALASRLPVHSGLRVPGAWDAFELAVRAILGQQVSVAAASTLAGRLAATFGEQLSRPTSGGLRVLFPEPKALAHADLSSIGLPGRGHRPSRRWPPR